MTRRLAAALVCSVATCGLGFGVIYLTWTRIAATTVVHEQMSYLSSGAPTGLALVLLGTIGLSMAARRTAAARTRGLRPFLLDLIGGLLAVAGLAVFLAGWQGVARTDVVHDQVSYLASAVPAGVALLVLGAGLISIATDRALGARRLADFDDAVASAVRSARP